MKYLDKVIEENADGEYYVKGKRLELTELEISFIHRALKVARESDDFLIFFEDYGKLINDLETCSELGEKGLRNVEL